MLRPDYAKWNQTAEDLLKLSTEAENPRSRERYLALYMIGSEQSNATQWAMQIGREDQTVMGWVHLYNAVGPEGVAYCHSGGRSPLFNQNAKAEIVATVKNSTPIDHELPGRGWTLKKLRQWVAAKLGRHVSRNTRRTILKAAGLSWKKCKKLLAKAKPAKREEFVADFQRLYDRMCDGEVVIIYLDEVHIHQDMAVAYTWSPIGEADWVHSTSPGLSARINWFGAYNFTDGDCFIWENGTCDSANCMQFLQQLADRFQDDTRQIVLIWDGASYHRSWKVQDFATVELGFDILPLPAYSPDLNPIEGLWKWMREEVTQHYCHDSLAELQRSCLDFIATINQIPEQIIARLWPHFELDPDVEKLRFSF